MEPHPGDLPPAGSGPLLESDEVMRLRSELVQAHAELADTVRARDLAFAQIAAQDDRIARVQALADLADWAAGQELANLTQPTVRVSDLRRSLR
ncbi:MAG: hypothetical protein M3070_16400 [Actinomycetota bacterium]|nr:hypothetical protein [Actinomycetota bacterium]